MSLTADERFALLDVIARYNLAADQKDVEATLALYTDDGHIDGDMTTGRGKDAMREDLPRIFQAEVTLKRHIATNVRFGEPTASGEVQVGYVLLVMEAGAVPAAVATSLVTDTFRRDGDTWKVAHHHVAVDPSARWMVKAAEAVQSGIETVKKAIS